MKILITGAKGQLGSELQKQLEQGKSALGNIPAALLGAQVFAVDLPETDLSDLAAARKALQNSEADVVVNCAAFTNVDTCETQQDSAFKANALLVRNLAVACEETGAKLVHVSTDYVFSGEAAEQPLAEFDLPAPRSIYGKTKLLGEEYLQSFCSRWFIVRTAWLYGENGKNFVKTIASAARKYGALTVVNDQIGNPTNAEDLAHHILKLLCTEEYGIYHITGNGICSWYDFAEKIVSFSGINATVSPCTTEEYAKEHPAQAARPAYSALEHHMLRATVGDDMRPWQDALADYIKAGYAE